MDLARRWGPPVLLGIAIVSTLWFAWEHRDIPAFGSMQDDAIYLLSARSMAFGSGYRVAQLPGAPAQTKYPPGYPTLLAIAWNVWPSFPDNLVLAAALGVTAYLALVWFAYRVFRQYGFGEPVALLLTAAVAANASIVHLSAAVMTELPFTALLLATLWTCEAGAARSWRWHFLSGLLAACAYLTRTAALPLALTVPLILGLRGQRVRAVVFLAAMAPAIAGWQAWIAAHPSSARDWVTLFYTDYTGLEKATVSWNNIAQVVYTNLDTLLTGMGNLSIFMIGRTAMGHQLARLIGVVALVGAFRLCRRTNKWHYSAYALAFCLLLLIWHYPPVERFTVPLLPLLLAGLWAEGQHLVQLIQTSWRRPAPSSRIAAVGVGATLSMFVALFVWSTLETRLVGLPAAAALSRRSGEELRTAFRAVVRHTPPDAVIQSDQDGLLYLHTGRRSYRTIVPPRLFYPMDIADIRASFAEIPDAAGRPWDFALVTRSDWDHTLDAAERKKVRERIARRTDLAVLYEDKFATLYRRKLRDPEISSNR